MYGEVFFYCELSDGFYEAMANEAAKPGLIGKLGEWREGFGGYDADLMYCGR